MKRICLEDPSIPKNPLLNNIFSNRANELRITCDASSYMNRNGEDKDKVSRIGSSNNKIIIKQYNANGIFENAKMISIQATNYVSSKRSYPYFHQETDENSPAMSFIKKCH